MTEQDIINNIEAQINVLENNPTLFKNRYPSEYVHFKHMNRKYNTSKEYSMRDFKKFLNLVFNKCFILRNRFSRDGYYFFKCIDGEFFVKYPDSYYTGFEIVEKHWYSCKLILLLPPHNSNIRFVTQEHKPYIFKQEGIWFDVSKHNGVRRSELLVFDDEDSMELYLELNNL